MAERNIGQASQDFFVELLFGDLWVGAASFPFSFGGFAGEEGLVAFGLGFSGLAWVSAFGAGSRPDIRVLTTHGVEMLGGLSDSDASTVGRHWNAVRRYLEYGDESDLQDFEGITVAGHQLETDPDVVEWHAIRGDVRFESIYDEVV